jgi:hypothetical protein
VIAHPCARCGTVIEGLGVGAVCPTCAGETKRRSARLARRVALASTLVLSAYLGARFLPGVERPFQGTARSVAVVAIVAWWWLSYRIAKEVARICLR